MSISGQSSLSGRSLQLNVHGTVREQNVLRKISALCLWKKCTWFSACNQSSGWLKPVLLGPAGFLFHGKALKFNIQSDISMGLATLHFRKSDSYRNLWNLSDKKWGIVTLFTSFSTRFSPFWRLWRISAKTRELLASILCCWRPYCAVGVPADARTVVG